MFCYVRQNPHNAQFVSVLRPWRLRGLAVARFIVDYLFFRTKLHTEHTDLAGQEEAQ